MSDVSITDSTETWRLLWFPPNVAQSSRTFKSVEAVNNFLESQAEDDAVSYPAREWNPILTHLITTVVEENVPLHLKTPAEFYDEGENDV